MNRYPAVVPLADISIARTNVSTGANKENQASGLIRFPLFSNEKLVFFGKISGDFVLLDHK